MAHGERYNIEATSTGESRISGTAATMMNQQGGYVFPQPRISAADASRRHMLLGTKRKLCGVECSLNNGKSAITVENAINATTALNATTPPTCCSPAEFVLSEFKANGLDIQQYPDHPTFLTFLKPTKEMIEGYKKETITVIRSGSIEQARALHCSSNGGISFQCCNRFGESLIHLACRRGNVDVVRYLINEANVSLLVRDDFGRTPLHDACWTSKPRFDLVELIVREIPELLCVKDLRGHTPLHYVRKEHQVVWLKFFVENRSLLRPKKANSTNTAVAVVG